jgi:hypothetical protein
VAAFVACSDAAAQFSRAEGTFQAKGLVVQVVLLDPDKGVAAVGTNVSQGACSGSVSGIGHFVSTQKLVFEPYVKEERWGACKVSVEFDRNWRTAKVTEEGCTAYHGASCGWEGQVATKK